MELLFKLDVIANIVKKMDEFLKLQASERKTLQDSFHEQTSTVLGQFQLDLQCISEEKTKLQVEFGFLKTDVGRNFKFTDFDSCLKYFHRN